MVNWKRVFLLTALLMVGCLCSSGGGGSGEEEEPEGGEHGDNSSEHEGGDHSSGIHIVHVDFENIKGPLILVCWVLIAVGVKVLYHSFERFANFCPESCVLIIVGLIAGLVLRNASPDESMLLSFDSHLFFIFLLPPIVLDAGWCMPPRHFFDNIGLILAFAIFGTLINSFGIGLGLFGLIKAGAINVTSWEHFPDGNQVETTIGLPGCLLFGSLIAAVDPVAVLAVFDSVHVNEVLHIVVEGESLLNDAVSVVLYKIMNVIVQAKNADESLELKEYGVGFIAFLVISGGGTLIGLIYAIITSVFTRTLTHVRVVEPLVVFFFAYLSYLTAELFHWSGILAIIFCGFGMRHYVEENISRKSHTTIKYFMKMLAVSCESVIFMFLGLALVTVHFDINWAFIGFSIILCLLFRGLVVISFVYISNTFRVQKIKMVDQFIMMYGGLRGAISFSLAFILSSDYAWKDLIVTTTFVVIIFTVFIQGITIGPLVKLLRVTTHEKKKPSLNEEIIEHVMAHVMWGFEEVVGKHGENYYRQWFDHIDNKYLMRWFTNKKINKNITHGDAMDILQVFHNLEQRDAMNMAQKHEVLVSLNRRSTTGDSGAPGYAPSTPTAPQLPPVGEADVLMDENVSRYQRLPESTAEESSFDAIKSKAFAAMKMNARPVQVTQSKRNRLTNAVDDDFSMLKEIPVIQPDDHHSMLYYQNAPMERPHHHHHHHDRRKRQHHGEHKKGNHRHHRHKHGHHKHGGHHGHRGSGSAGNGAAPEGGDEGAEGPALPFTEGSPDEVKMYDFGNSEPVADPAVHHPEADSNV